MNRDSVAPTTAPAHIVRTTENRSFSRLPVPPASLLSTPIPTMVDVRTVVLELLDAELPRRRVLAAERHRQTGDQDQLRVVVIVEHTRSREYRQRRQQNAFHCKRHRHPAAGVVLEVAGESAADHRSGQEADEGDDGRRHVDDVLLREPEPEKYDVTGHVGDEYVAKHQHADRVDHAGPERQQQQSSHRQPIGDRRGDVHDACPTAEV